MTKTHTTTRTTPATPILEWEAEALNHLADLKFKAEEAKAVLDFARQTLREVQDENADEYEIDMAWKDAIDAADAFVKAEGKFTSFYLNYRA
jgi:hypothetical protein